MNAVLFEWEGMVLNGGYLLGDYSFGYAVKIVQAVLTCRQPASRSLALNAGVGGSRRIRHLLCRQRRRRG